MADVKDKIYNIDLVVEDIKKVPQTYLTILKEYCNDGTCQLLIRKKLNRLIKDGTICKCTIPGTRFGQVIFFMFPKKYHIIFQSGRMATETYYFFDFEKLDKFRIKVKDIWKLEGKDWVHQADKIFLEGEVLKWI